MTYEELEDVPCPQCGQVGSLDVEVRLAAAVPPLVSLSGMQMKLGATKVPFLVCKACGFAERGRVE